MKTASRQYQKKALGARRACAVCGTKPLSVSLDGAVASAMHRTLQDQVLGCALQKTR